MTIRQPGLEMQGLAQIWKFGSGEPGLVPREPAEGRERAAAPPSGLCGPAVEASFPGAQGEEASVSGTGVAARCGGRRVPRSPWVGPGRASEQQEGPGPHLWAPCRMAPQGTGGAPKPPQLVLRQSRLRW